MYTAGTLTNSCIHVKKGDWLCICLLWLQSTSNIWMTHAEMESLTAATKPVRLNIILPNNYKEKWSVVGWWSLSPLIQTSVPQNMPYKNTLLTLISFFLFLCLWLGMFGHAFPCYSLKICFDKVFQLIFSLTKLFLLLPPSPPYYPVTDSL